MRKYLQIGGLLLMAYAIYASLFGSNPMMYTVYFPNTEGTHLVGEQGFERLEDEQLHNIALNQLMQGPSDDQEDLINPIPKGTKLVPFGDDLGPLVFDKELKIIMVNFSKEFVENHPKDADAGKMTIAAVVNTMTSFQSIEKVEIYVEGEMLEKLAGNSQINQPFEEFSELIKQGE